MSEATASDLPAKIVSATRRRGRIGERNRREILTAAERVFARRGYRGARLDEIAEEVALPKANLLYYFKSKEALYEAVIADILEVWLGALGEISVDDDPAEALTGYIQRKMALSKERPEASRVFAMEVITGAPVIGGYLQGYLRAWVERQGTVFRTWQRRGMMADLPPEHVFFTIWAVTQTYADFAPQVTAVLGVDRLDDGEFRDAVETVTAIVLRGLGIPIPAAGSTVARRQI
ncbi:transcriptional regulator, TetR family protein [alpha proteobacterium BAL199]|jgi:TetR/AcrR family transcriptional regulator|nr:transcriptional regulator, TetR family protein [alpha proteobacterium BAL199]